MKKVVLDPDGNMALVVVNADELPPIPAGYTVKDWTPELAEKRAPEPPKLRLERVKARRNRLLDDFAWTVSAASPLTAASQAKWLVYLKALHRITRNNPDPATINWPEQPPLEYS